MKKGFLLSACAWILCLSHATADEISIGDITVPQGGVADLTVGYSFTSTTDKVGFTFSIALPEGICYVKDEDGDPVFVKDGISIEKLNIVCAGEGNFAGQAANASATIKGTSGNLLTLTIAADASLDVGSSYPVQVTKATFQERVEGSVRDIFLDDFTFTITIGEPADTRTVLDENSTTVPAAATNVDVRVKRTIKANEWSTIVLPFDMTEAQVKEVFGDDVQLGDFDGAESEFDEEDNVTGITVNFNDASAIEANHPYVINVSQPVEEFTIDGVDIVADEDEAYIEFDNGKSGSRRVVYSGFYGTYHAGTVLDEFTLFLNDNKFWYSTGQTKMKAFRAYFSFLDVLTEVKDAAGVIEFKMNFDDATGLKDIDHSTLTNDHNYNLAGQRVGKNYKGIVVTKGKKILY